VVGILVEKHGLTNTIVKKVKETILIAFARILETKEQKERIFVSFQLASKLSLKYEEFLISQNKKHLKTKRHLSHYAYKKLNPRKLGPDSK
jgi:hypothetical protein